MKREDESAIDYLRRVVSNLNHETETLLDDLKSTDMVDVRTWEVTNRGGHAGESEWPEIHEGKVVLA